MLRTAFITQSLANAQTTDPFDLQTPNREDMYLKQLIIVNYKSCQYLDIEPLKDDPTVFIGINDCGKSTILKSIGLLLDEKMPYYYEDDAQRKNDLAHSLMPADSLSKKLQALGLPMLNYGAGGDRKSFVIGALSLEERDLILIGEKGCTNHLLWVIDNLEEKSDKSIWLAREFDMHGRQSTLFLLTPDTKNREQFYDLGQTKLKAIQKEKSISDEEVENENRKGPYKNIERARAIYAREELVPYWVAYKIKNDLPLFPRFQYLDWNITISDLEEYTKEILEKEIQPHLDAANKATKIESDKAQHKVNEELANISKEITADIPDVEGLEANIHFEIRTKITDFLVKKVYAKESVHIHNQGDGMQRQIWFGLMRWKAKRDRGNESMAKDFIWCFDEPETHLYPKAQREFFGLIQQISRQNIQTILSTHSSIFIDRAKLPAINQVKLNSGLTSYTKCADVEDVYQALHIKNSDFLFYDRFLLVEGDTEAVLVPHLYKIYSGGNSLYEDGIQLIKLGGSDKREQNKRILKSLLRQFQKLEDRVIYLLDNDVSLSGGFREPAEVHALFVGKQDIEDGICSKVWANLFNNLLEPQVSITPEEIDEIKREIPRDRVVPSTEKFFPILRKIMVRKIQEAGGNNELFKKLPSDKGTIISEQLCEYITSLEQVDPNIRRAFDLFGHTPKPKVVIEEPAANKSSGNM